MRKAVFVFIFGWFSVGYELKATIINFSDVNLQVPPATEGWGGVYYNGDDGVGGFTSGGAFFAYTFTEYPGGFSGWTGFSYSTATDTTTIGYVNQYSSIAGSGFDDTVYAVGFESPEIVLGSGMSSPLSMYITNTTYTALSMLDGDDFAKKFGGGSGDDADFFKLAILGWDAMNNSTGSVEFYLADFRFADNSQDYIVTDWQLVDLTDLGGAVSRITFEFYSSDMHPEFGINTPTYFAIDHFVVVPEPAASAAVLGIAVGLLVLLRRRCVNAA